MTAPPIRTQHPGTCRARAASHQRFPAECGLVLFTTFAIGACSSPSKGQRSWKQPNSQYMRQAQLHLNEQDRPGKSVEAILELVRGMVNLHAVHVGVEHCSQHAAHPVQAAVALLVCELRHLKGLVALTEYLEPARVTPMPMGDKLPPQTTVVKEVLDDRHTLGIDFAVQECFDLRQVFCSFDSTHASIGTC